MNQATIPATIRNAMVALCVLVIATAETAALGLILIALFTPQPTVPGADTDQYDTVWFTSVMAGFLTTLALMMTILLVNLQHARARWLWIPTAMLLAILVRYHTMPNGDW